MAIKPTQKTVDPQALTAPDFRWFLMHTPTVVLEARKIQRLSYFAVGMALAQFGNYERGTGIRVSQVALAEITGADRRTVRKVLNLLKEMGALQVTDLQRRPGRASENYNLRKSSTVAKVLEIADRKHTRPEASNGSQMLIQSDEWVPDAHSTGTDAHNKNQQNVKNPSVANAPSASPSSLGLSPRSESREDEEVLTVERMKEAWAEMDEPKTEVVIEMDDIEF